MARRNAVILGAGILGIAAAGGAFWLLSDDSVKPAPRDSTEAAPAIRETSSPAKSAPLPAAGTAAAPAPPSTATGSIVGRLVRGTPPTPIAGEVTVSGASLPARKISTGADGRFLVEGLPREARIDVVASSEGLLPAKYPGLWIERRGVLDMGDIPLGAAQRVEVQVRDRGSRPVAGAVVSLVRNSGFSSSTDWISGQLRPPAPPSPEGSGQTDAKGTALFEAVPPGYWGVRVEAAGFAKGVSSANVIEGEAREPVRVVLLPACELSGTVFGIDGKPLAGVMVQGMRGMSGSWSQEFGRSECVTGPDGAYRLLGLQEGTVQLQVRLGPDRQQAVGAVTIPGVSRFDIRLGEGFTVKGTVLDAATNQPVPGALVTLQVWPPQGGAALALTRAETGPEGTFRFENLPLGNLGSVQVRKQGFLDWPDPLATVTQAGTPAAGSVEEREVRLHRGAAVRGKVVDTAGNPVGNARVLLYTNTPNAGSQQSDPVISTADGTYRMENVPPGRALASARATGFYQPKFPAQYWQVMQQGTLPEECSVDVPKEGEVVRDFVLSTGAVVEGEVLLPGGGAAVGYRPSVGGSGGKPGGGGVAGPTDAEGKFRATTVAPGEDLVVRVTGPRCETGASEPFRLGEGETVRGIRVALKAGGSIAGRVRREDGKSAQGATLRLLTGAQTGNDEWRIRSAPVHPVGTDGEFRIENVAIGKYTLLASAEGAAPATVSPVDVAEGAVKDGVEILLGTGRSIAGTVTHEANAPVAGARITVKEAPKNEGQYYGGPREDPVAALADAEGKFTLFDLGEGPYEVAAESPGFVRRSATVKGGRTDLVLVLKAGAILAGTVVEESDGKPIAEIAITVNPATPQMGGMWNGKQGKSGADGTFRIEGLDPEQEYVVSAGQPWGTARTDHIPVNLPKTKAGATDLRFSLRHGFTISGTLVDEQGVPVTARLNLQVIGRNAEGNPDYARQRYAPTEPDGTFRVTGLESGVYDLTVNAQNFGQQTGGYAPATLKGVNAGTEGHVLTLRKGLAISGRVEDEKGTSNSRQNYLMVAVSGEAGGQAATYCQVQGDGTFTTQSLDPTKTYDLTIGGSGGSMGGVLRGVAPGAKDVVVRISKGGVLSGRVVDEAGTALGRGIPVTAVAEGAQSNMPGGRSMAVTNPDGTFTLEGLGEFKFKVSAGGGTSDFQHSPAEGLFAPGAADVEIRAKAGVTITGRLVNASGDAARTQMLMANPDGIQGEKSCYTNPAEDGTFTLKGMKPGKYALQAWQGQGWLDCGTFEAPASGVTVTVPAK